MKKLTTLILLSFTLIISSSSGQDRYRYIENDSFGKGEILKFRVHWKFVNAAEATMEISDTHYNVNGRPCYKIDVYGKTVGLVDVAIRIRDQWGAYVDTASILPQKAYRYMEEGKYRKNEMINFNHSKDVATVLRLDKETRKLKEKEEFEVPNNVLDIVGGYYFLRTIDYSQYKAGDMIEMKGFFDDEVYDIYVKFLGREEVKTKLGTFNSIVIAPILPDNNFFSGDDPVRVWISDDLNKVPLKIKAELGVGALEIDIKEMKNLRN